MNQFLRQAPQHSLKNLELDSNINLLWADLIVEELIRQGCEYFCIAPGSRSGPLAIAVARNPKAQNFVHFDERGLAFHALGYCSATNRPAVLICTSGTAVANFFPAVVEASKKKLPLIVLTADRPWELRKTGANQTIDQPGIFGEYVRSSIDLPCPDRQIPPEAVLTTVDQIVFRSQGDLRGPAHLNCMFREPLVPVSTGQDFSGYLKNLLSWRKGTLPYTRYAQAQRIPLSQEFLSLANNLNKIKSGLIVVGKIASSSGGEEQRAILRLAEKLGWPVFADITSGLRLGCSHPQVIHHFDQILLSEKMVRALKVDCVLHLGGRITSKRFYDWLIAQSPAQYVMVLNHPLRNDPTHKVSLRFQCGVKIFAEKLIPLLSARKKSTWVVRLNKLSAEVEALLEKEIFQGNTLSEPLLSRLISRHLPKQSGLFLSNSMPIRDMDMFASLRGAAVRVGANRGASGIDGIIASACGFAVGLNRMVTLLIGDLAFLHDLNSLSMLSRLRNPFVVVVVNNDGGAIFSFLPIAGFPDVMETHFTTPHGLTFESAAKSFGLHYESPQTPQDFVRVYKMAFLSAMPTLIEININRQENFSIHQDIQKKVLNSFSSLRKL